MVEAMRRKEKEIIKWKQTKVNDVRFAKFDQEMVAGTEGELQKIRNSLDAKAEMYRTKMNINETSALKVFKKTGEKVNIVTNGDRIEQIQDFKYIGDTTTENGRCETEIKS